MAAVVAPARVSAKHQSLLHLVGQAAWSDEAVLTEVRGLVLPAIEAQGRIEAWIVDDTGFVKRGVHSVGGARQYCGRLGKTDNCQIAVTLSIANHAASLPIAYRLYLPEDWAADEARRKKAHVPDEVKFRTKPDIALAQIRAALAAGVVLADAGYGVNGAFRSGVTAMGLTYAMGVQPTLSVWPADQGPLPSKPWSGRGRKPSRMRRDADHRPPSAKKLAMALTQEEWRTVVWREGSNEALSLRFAAMRLRPASRGWQLRHPMRSNGSSSNGRRAKKSLRKRGSKACASSSTRRRPRSRRPRPTPRRRCARASQLLDLRIELLRLAAATKNGKLGFEAIAAGNGPRRCSIGPHSPFEMPGTSHP